MSAVVRFDHVTKQYRRGRERVNLKAALPGRWGAGVGGNQHAAVSDLSFELGAGESLGFVGPNGAGKSTTLKLVAGVIAPTTGRVAVHGRTLSLIELGAGFHQDMTGRENVYFSAAVLGMGPRALRSRFDQIVEFAGIDDFLDTPVKRYSSGMMARLGFAIASHLDVEVVVLDEVLAVGDAEFQRRCHERIRQLRHEGASLLYVTHALWTLPQLCDRALLLVNGRVITEGVPQDVLSAYERYHLPATTDGSDSNMHVLRSVNLSRTVVEPWGPLTVDVELDLPGPFPFGQILVSLATTGEVLLGTTASVTEQVSFDHAGPVRVSCVIEHLPLQPGPYTVAVAFCGDSRVPVLDDVRAFGITVRGDQANPAFGATLLPVSWQAHGSPEALPDLPSGSPAAPQAGLAAERRGL